MFPKPLSAGPAVPALGKYASGSGIRLWLHHIAHGGSLRLKDAAWLLAANMRAATVGLVAAVAVLTGSTWLAYRDTGDLGAAYAPGRGIASAASVAAGGSSLKNSAMAPAKASDSPAYRIQ